MSPTTEVTVETRRDVPITVVAYPSGGAGVTGPATTVLVDTGSWVPAGRSQLRVANLTANAERRTVLLLDSPSGPRFVVVAD